MSLLDTGLIAHRNPIDTLQFPQIEKPQIVGSYSVNTNRDYEQSTENFRYFRMPTKFPLDLNKGYGLAKAKDEQLCLDERLDHLLQFIYHHQDDISRTELQSNKGIGDIDFICFRGLLRLIMCTPYETRDDWCVHATRYKGNIYLCQKETDQKYNERCTRNESQRKFLAYGFKFEQFCLTTNPTIEPNTDAPVDECEEFGCVFKTNVEGMHLLYAAEIDGAISNTVCQNIEKKEVLGTLKLVELKCSLRPSNERQHQNFNKFKLKNWWCQSFLVGIQDLMVGFRNDAGLVDEIQHMEVRSLPKLATNYWNPAHCVDFLVKFLRMVKNLMKNVNCPHTVYEFYFNPRSRRISYRVHGQKSIHTILPDWYVAMIQNRSCGTTFKRTISNIKIQKQ